MNNPTPECLAESFKGPVTPGGYTIRSSEVDDPVAAYDRVREFFLGDWGDWRVRLHPAAPVTANARTNFFMHCGADTGSAGCIDIGGGLSGNTTTDRVKDAIERASNQTVCLEVIP
jgi:hypothetical protein